MSRHDPEHQLVMIPSGVQDPSQPPSNRVPDRGDRKDQNRGQRSRALTPKINAGKPTPLTALVKQVAERESPDPSEHHHCQGAPRLHQHQTDRSHHYPGNDQRFYPSHSSSTATRRATRPSSAARRPRKLVPPGWTPPTSVRRYESIGPSRPSQ